MSFSNKFELTTVTKFIINSWFIIRLCVLFLPVYILIAYKIKALFFQAALLADPQILPGIIIESPTGSGAKVLSCILAGVLLYVALEGACKYTKEWRDKIEDCRNEWNLVDIMTGGVTKLVCITIQAGIWIIEKTCEIKEVLAIGTALVCLALTAVVLPL